MAHPQLDGERICDSVDQVRNCLANEGTQDARRDLGRGVIHGYETGTHRRQLVRTTRHFVRLDGQLGTPSTQLQRTAYHQAGAGLERAREIALIEPRQRNLARVVRQTRLQDAQASASGRSLRNRADTPNDSHLVFATLDCLRDRRQCRHVLKAKRQVVE